MTAAANARTMFTLALMWLIRSGNFDPCLAGINPRFDKLESETMSQILQLAVAGLGRMGSVHARNVLELEAEGAGCQLAAVADSNQDRVRRFRDETSWRGPSFTSVRDLAQSSLCQATVVVTPTAEHREHASALIEAGQRVLVEKPLTGTLEGDRDFVAELD